MKAALKAFGIVGFIALMFYVISIFYDWMYGRWGHQGYELVMAGLFGSIIFVLAYVVFQSRIDKDKRAKKFISEKKCVPCDYEIKRGTQ